MEQMANNSEEHDLTKRIKLWQQKMLENDLKKMESVVVLDTQSVTHQKQPTLNDLLGAITQVKYELGDSGVICDKLDLLTDTFRSSTHSLHKQLWEESKNPLIPALFTINLAVSLVTLLLVFGALLS